MKLFCETCGTNDSLTRSHFVKTNSVAKTKLADYDYEDPKNYMTQCLQCHMKYEVMNKKYRLAFLNIKGLKEYSERVKYLIEL